MESQVAHREKSAASASEFMAARVVNTLLGADKAGCERSVELERGLRFFQKSKANGCSFSVGLRRLIRLHNNPNWGFVDCDLAQSGGILFVHKEVQKALRRLAGEPQALLILLGLRQLCVGEGSYFTKERQRDYTRSCALIEELALRYSHEATRLCVLFAD